jgi:two-component system chemotaxis sensor kinase CheA
LKIKTKLYTGFGSLLALLVLMLALVLNMLQDLNASINEIVKDRYAKAKWATTIRYEVSNMTRGLYTLAIDDRQSVDDIAASINEAKKREEFALIQLERTASIQSAIELISQLRVQSQTYEREQARILEQLRSGQRQQATAMLLGEISATRLAMFDTVEKLNTVQEGRMDTALQDATKTYDMAVKATWTLIVLSLLVGGLIAFGVVRSTTGNLRYVASVITRVTEGSKEDLPRIKVDSKDEIGEISQAFNAMAVALEEHARHEREFQRAIQDQNWLKTKLAETTTMYQGVQDLETLARMIMSKLTPLVNASYGVFYVKEGSKDQQRLVKFSSYADSEGEVGHDSFRVGEGLVGQCAAENRTILLTDIPAGYIQITSGLGAAAPASLLVLPVEHEGNVRAVIELASFEPFTELQLKLLEQVVETVGITINSIAYHMQVERLLKESQAMTEELQSQSEELQLQQEELKTINEKLEEQYNNSETKTRELQKTKEELEDKARQLVLSSKYKSEFLANMSHELRTPLNSLLILAQMLAENAEGNLTHKQIEFANTIHASGHDLLTLINDVLDLSKVESGKMEVHMDEILLEELRDYAERHFGQLARQKNLDFSSHVHPDVPGAIYTDEVRLQQILKNLLSNAFKFTDSGSVQLQISLADPHSFAEGTSLRQARTAVAFSVTDTGIGIPPEQQGVIFEAFRQADGTTSRKYGGTGLGLSISREIAQLLGGHLEVISVEGKGSTFTLYLPTDHLPDQALVTVPAAGTAHPALFAGAKEAAADVSPLMPEVEGPLEGKKVLLVDDDMRNIFALTTALEANQMKVIFAENGREGLELLRANPDVDLVLMDIMMPEMDGYEAMRAIRQSAEHEDLPIIALTAKAMKNDRAKCIDAGASDYISKPLNLEQLFSLMRVWLYR